MRLCKVIGSTVSTIKHPCYHGKKLLVVQPLDLDLQPQGPSFLATDGVGAGAGETVLVCEEGRSAALIFATDQRTPLRSAVVAIIDRIDLEDTLGNAIELEIVGIFSASAEIYAADLIVVPIETAREYFGYGDDEASDICVYLDDPVNTGLAAVRILELGDNVRIVTRDAMAALSEQAFGRRGGVFQLMWMVLLLTVSM